jgi:hypothetical protein
VGAQGLRGIQIATGISRGAGNLLSLKQEEHPMNKRNLAVLSMFCLMASLPSKGADQPDKYRAKMLIPKNAALLKDGDQMSGLDLKTLRDAFNESSEKVRVVSILSPTCSACQEGHRAVKKVFSDFKSEKLRGFLVWLPMRSKDDARMALAQSADFKDGRIDLQGWDANKEIAKQFSKTLDLKVAAWDVYLVYAPGVKWPDEAAPPAPTFWMHQLSPEQGGNPKQCLNVAKLKAEIKRLL